MAFSIKRYYNITESITNKEIINKFMDDLKNNLDEYKTIFDFIKNHKNFIYPQDCLQIARKIKSWIVIICILLEKITKNPIFILNAETFQKNKYVATLDSFNFFLEILLSKLSSDDFDLQIINDYINVYNENKNLNYSVFVEQLCSIEQDDFKERVNERLFSAHIK